MQCKNYSYEENVDSINGCGGRFCFCLRNSPGKAEAGQGSHLPAAERISDDLLTIPHRGKNKLRTRATEDEFLVAGDCATLHNIITFPPALGATRGPARVLERLPQTIACLLSHRVVSSYVRAGKDQLPPAKQRDRQSHPLQKNRCSNGGRCGKCGYRQRL